MASAMTSMLRYKLGNYQSDESDNALTHVK
jgi:hypothetical protein